MTTVVCETILGIVQYTDALVYQVACVSDYVMLMLQLEKFVNAIKSWKIV